jgi:hypothetical protein
MPLKQPNDSQNERRQVLAVIGRGHDQSPEDRHMTQTEEGVHSRHILRSDVVTRPARNA